MTICTIALFRIGCFATDFDGDGDVDLYGCKYGSPNRNPPLPYHDANNGTPNLMLRNDGYWRFTDVTREVGLDENNLRYSFAASWVDYDNDGDPDLYVANDFGRNNLYRNDGGQFTDVAGDAGVEDISAGMSVILWSQRQRTELSRHPNSPVSQNPSVRRNLPR